ncbi:PREDICTED: melanoma-associated antigen B1-like [Chrysochloris asiatica]|uniref:Melanoma-associated antigen B1-like n=1 Tax=Chrysochloris asiatica TaxID=185453 RepID=A0A9B0T9Q7_CHRAS|nr:PREDICTED: melanoma-associated antigen B1-like [Chrysochloris asiatica]
MPRGLKSKLRAREKRQQVRGVKGAQASAAEEEGSPPSSPLGGSPQSSPAAQSPQGPQRASSATTADAACTRAAEGAKGQDNENPSSSGATPTTESSQRDPITQRVTKLLQFLLRKYNMKECISKKEMIKVINKRYKEQFPEILRKASEHIELIFGLDLKELDSKGSSYVIVSKLETTEEENLSTTGFPKNGILIPLLGMIYMNGNGATEEEVWDFLNVMGVYDGKRHFIFGEPRKLITKDLVQQKYLEYFQVPNSDPPRYEFRWGPRAHAEASKMKIVEFLAKVNDTDVSVFQAMYEEAWKEGC